MCPMMPISLLAIFLFALIELSSAASNKLRFQPEMIQIFDGKSMNVLFSSLKPFQRGNSTAGENLLPNEVLKCSVLSLTETTATAQNCEVQLNETTQYFEGRFRVSGHLLGHTTVKVKIEFDSGKTVEETVPVTVFLYKSIAQHIFLGSIIVLVLLNYVNMGCAVDLHIIRETLKKPVGPVVGLFTQFGVMPLLSYITATYFLDEPYLKLGIFTFGCSPGGGASNMWTVLLGGNLDLSVTMTFLSTIASLGFMPLWLFTVGKTFFKETTPKIPFGNIVGGLVGMVIPLGVGLLMQRFCPKGTAFCRKILIPFSIVMVIFIIVFGTYANLYMIHLITWEIAFAAILNVWTGFLIGLILARMTGLPWRDAVAVMVETGVQNTGVAIVLLSVSLPKPDGDMAGIVPVAAATMMPIPLTILWLVLKCFRCRSTNEKVRDVDAKFRPLEKA